MLCGASSGCAELCRVTPRTLTTLSSLSAVPTGSCRTRAEDFCGVPALTELGQHLTRGRVASHPIGKDEGALGKQRGKHAACRYERRRITDHHSSSPNRRSRSDFAIASADRKRSTGTQGSARRCYRGVMCRSLSGRKGTHECTCSTPSFVSIAGFMAHDHPFSRPTVARGPQRAAPPTSPISSFRVVALGCRVEEHEEPQAGSALAPLLASRHPVPSWT
jgi:hypothetical protein